jgi:hypothetical protein
VTLSIAMGVQYYWCKMCWIHFFIWNQWIKYKLWRWVSSERYSQPCWIWQQNTICCALLDPFRFYTVCHYKNALNTFLMPLIALIILLISLIGCLKFHTFMFAMPIAQGNVFLQFEICHTCVNIFSNLARLPNCIYMVCTGWIIKYLPLSLPCN